MIERLRWIPGLQSAIGRRLLLYLLLFSSLITFAGTVLQLYLDYEHDVANIRSVVDRVRYSHLESIATSMWVADDNLLVQQLSGILSIPDIRYVEVAGANGSVVSQGSPLERNKVERTFSMFRSYNGREIFLGNLTVAAGLDGVYHRIMDRVFVMLGVQAAKTLLVSTFFFIIFHILVGRHLYAMADYTRSLRFDSLDGPLELGLNGQPRNAHELCQLQEAINDMRFRLERELSERKRSEKALATSEMRFRTAFNQSFQYMAILDRAGNMLELNDLANEMMLSDGRDLIGRPFHSAPWWNMEDPVNTSLKEILRKVAGGESRSDETTYLDRDGVPRHALRAFAPVRDEKGKVTRIVVQGVDITDRKKSEEERRKTYRMLSAVIENTSDAIFIKDLKGRYILANPAVSRAVGRPLEEILGNTDADLFPEDSFNVIRKVDLRVLAENRPALAEERLDTALGDTWWLANKSPWRDEAGEVIGLIGISRNITELKSAQKEKAALEEQLRHARKMEAVGTLAGGVAHDFNNILGIIIGNVELAMDDAPDHAGVRTNLRAIKDAGLRARDVVRQLLNFSRKAENPKRVIRLQPVVEEAVRLLRATIPALVAIRADIDPDAGSMEADASQIHQILLNFCTNAAQAMEESGGEIFIRLGQERIGEADLAQHPELSPGPHLRLTVRDTGPGIPPEHLERVFDPYFTTKEVGKGTGMGLAVVHGIVKRHRGVVSVDSAPGRGATFEILFPVRKETGNEDAGPPGHEAPAPEGRGERVLLVDDEPAIVAVGRKMLAVLGYRVTVATDPFEAVRIFNTDPAAFDLVITDMAMPGMTGETLAGKIAELRPELPVILITGYSARVDERTVANMPVFACVEKPLQRYELAAVVRRALSGER